MKRYFLLLAIIITLTTVAQVIYIPYAAAPQIDGTLGGSEWSNAGSVDISVIANTAIVHILFQHDSSNLYIAYLGNLQKMGTRFPEVLIDVSNDKSAVWMSDDWWFHVSATDCEYIGAHSNYDSCMLVRPNWTAVPNFTGGPVVDTVEIAIHFATIGYDINSHDTLGLSFAVNDFIIWEYWPASADIDMPSTWGLAVFELTTGLEEDVRQGEFVKIFPNPSTDGCFTISSENPLDGLVSVRDMTGREVMRKSLSGSCVEVIDLSGKDAGMYAVSYLSKDGLMQKRVVVK